MNLKAIKERCEAAKIKDAVFSFQYRSAKDVPALLAWVERARIVISEELSWDETAQNLLAELEE